LSAIFVVDTNVVVAGLLTARADSPVAIILNGMMSAAFPFVLSEALLAEYRSVLVRPKLRKLHGLQMEEVDAILLDIARHAIVLTPVSGGTLFLAPDHGDQFLWDLLATRADLVLLTGDKLLLRDGVMGQRTMLPQTFTAQLKK
jgi:uncharacterized protein